jgi:hypothetical protein
MRHPHWLSIADGTFERLLSICPVRFRHEYGDEMRLLFRIRCERAAEEHGGIAAGWTCARSLLNVIATGLALRAADCR